MKLYIVSKVKLTSSRIDTVMDKPTSSNADKIAATQIKNLLIVSLIIYMYEFGLSNAKLKGIIWLFRKS